MSVHPGVARLVPWELFGEKVGMIEFAIAAFKDVLDRLITY